MRVPPVCVSRCISAALSTSVKAIGGGYDKPKSTKRGFGGAAPRKTPSPITIWKIALFQDFRSAGVWGAAGPQEYSFSCGFWWQSHQKPQEKAKVLIPANSNCSPPIVAKDCVFLAATFGGCFVVDFWSQGRFVRKKQWGLRCGYPHPRPHTPKSKPSYTPSLARNSSVTTWALAVAPCC